MAEGSAEGTSEVTGRSPRICAAVAAYSAVGEPLGMLRDASTVVLGLPLPERRRDRASKRLSRDENGRRPLSVTGDRRRAAFRGTRRNNEPA